MSLMTQMKNYSAKFAIYAGKQKIPVRGLYIS